MARVTVADLSVVSQGLAVGCRGSAARSRRNRNERMWFRGLATIWIRSSRGRQR